MTNVVKPPCDEGVIRSATDHAPCARATAFWVLAATILGSSMAFIDGTVVSVALPILQTDLGATVSELQWIVESYALFLAALLLIGGSLGDHFGRRRVFAIGVAMFAEVLDRFSGNLEMRGGLADQRVSQLDGLEAEVTQRAHLGLRFR